MKNLITLFLGLFLSFNLMAQTPPPLKQRSDEKLTQADPYLAALKGLAIPSGSVNTLTGVGTRVNLFYNTTEGKLKIHDGVEWRNASPVDLTGYYTKAEIETLFLPLTGGAITGNLAVSGSVDVKNNVSSYNGTQTSYMSPFGFDALDNSTNKLGRLGSSFLQFSKGDGAYHSLVPNGDAVGSTTTVLPLHGGILATDGEVLHKSGNETKSGDLSVTGDILAGRLMTGSIKTFRNISQNNIAGFMLEPEIGGVKTGEAQIRYQPSDFGPGLHFYEKGQSGDGWETFAYKSQLSKYLPLTGGNLSDDLFGKRFFGSSFTVNSGNTYVNIDGSGVLLSDNNGALNINPSNISYQNNGLTNYLRSRPLTDNRAVYLPDASGTLIVKDNALTEIGDQYIKNNSATAQPANIWITGAIDAHSILLRNNATVFGDLNVNGTINPSVLNLGSVNIIPPLENLESLYPVSSVLTTQSNTNGVNIMKLDKFLLSNKSATVSDLKLTNAPPTSTSNFSILLRDDTTGEVKQISIAELKVVMGL